MSNYLKSKIDAVSLGTFVVTLLLFGLALVEKGLTHDLLLEAGVFLVSLKVVLSSYKSELSNRSIESKVDRLLELVLENEKSPPKD